MMIIQAGHTLSFVFLDEKVLHRHLCHHAHTDEDSQAQAEEGPHHWREQGSWVQGCDQQVALKEAAKEDAQGP